MTYEMSQLLVHDYSPRRTSHAVSPLEWVLGANGEFTMTWWLSLDNSKPSKLFRGVVTRDPGWPEDTPIAEGDTVYIWGYMTNEQAANPEQHIDS